MVWKQLRALLASATTWAPLSSALAEDPTVLYSAEHMWTRYDGEYILVGISSHLSCMLGKITLIELGVSEGDNLGENFEFAVVESDKAATELSLPVAGRLVDVNDAVLEAPHLLRDDPEGSAWILQMLPTDLEQIEKLFRKDAYVQYVGGVCE